MTHPNQDASLSAMKTLFTAFALLIAQTAAYATQFEVRGYAPILSIETSIQKGERVSALTQTILSHAKESQLILNFYFNGLGMESLTTLDEEVLGNSMEIENDKEIRAYGWCYSVDGIAPDLLADEYVLTGNEKNITWFYGYATQILGHWESQCVPVSAP